MSSTIICPSDEEIKKLCRDKKLKVSETVDELIARLMDPKNPENKGTNRKKLSGN